MNFTDYFAFASFSLMTAVLNLQKFVQNLMFMLFSMFWDPNSFFCNFWSMLQISFLIGSAESQIFLCISSSKILKRCLFGDLN